MKRNPPEPPKVVEAPAYMGQFASLMTILLAFFIIMLSLGQNRSSQYKKGVGKIRNLGGIAGGTGVLEFWRSIRALPASTMDTNEDNKDAMLVGYKHGERDGFTLSDADVKSFDFEDARQSLRIYSKIRFDPGRVSVTRDTQFALDQAATLLYSMKKYRIVIEVRGDTGNPAADRKLAAQRAAWLSRHLIVKGPIPTDRIRAVGFCRMLDDGHDGPPPQVTFLLKRARNKEGDLPRPSSTGENDHG